MSDIFASQTHQFLSENLYFSIFKGVKNPLFDDKNIDSDQKNFKTSVANQY